MKSAAAVCRSVAAVIGIASGPLITALPAAHAEEFAFGYTGTEQTYVVPPGATHVAITAIGTPGGELLGAVGGAGGIATGIAPVTPGEVLYIEVGGNTSAAVGDPTFGGGGPGGVGAGGLTGENGAGATDVRTISMSDASTTLGSRLVVAAGGGGASAVAIAATPGWPGGWVGTAGMPTDDCGGATEPGCGGGFGSSSSGGAAGNGTGTAATVGEPGAGGAGGASSSGAGGGGGGGWEGGGGGGGGGTTPPSTAQPGGGGGGGSNGFAAAVTNRSSSIVNSGQQPGVRIAPLYTITVVKAGAGKGTVTGSGPISADSLVCGTKCSVALELGVGETLVAKPASAAYKFARWSGGCSGTSPVCTATVNGPTTVSATFARVPPPSTRLTAANVRHTTAKFRFSSAGVRTGFQCSLVKKGKTAHFATCKSPKKYTGLAKGHYVFEVSAKGPGGADQTPAKKSFSIKS